MQIIRIVQLAVEAIVGLFVLGLAVSTIVSAIDQDKAERIEGTMRRYARRWWK